MGLSKFHTLGIECAHGRCNYKPRAISSHRTRTLACSLFAFLRIVAKLIALGTAWNLLQCMDCPAAVQVIEGGEPVAIPNQEGRLTTPSTVAFLKGGDVLIGDAARRYADMG